MREDDSNADGTDPDDRLESLAERVDRLENRTLSTTAPDGTRVSLDRLLAVGLTRRQALAALGFVAAGATTAAAIRRAVGTVGTDDEGIAEDRFDARSLSGAVDGVVFAHEYDSSQEAVDDTEDGSTVVFLSVHGPYEEFVIPPRDDLTLTSDGALVETSLETGSDRYNEIIGSPTDHPDYEDGQELGSTTDVVTTDIGIGEERLEVEDASVLEAGDLVLLHDPADEWIAYPASDTDPPHRAEFLQVDDVDEDELVFRNGVSLEFENRELQVAAFDPVCSHLIIEGFRLFGAYDGGSEYEERGIVTDYCRDVTVRDVSTSNVGRLSVSARDCYGVRVRDVDVRNSGRYGVQASGASKNVRLDGIYASQMRYATQFISFGSEFGPTNGVTVSNSLAANCDYGFNVHPGAYRVSFHNCNTLNSRGYRIRSPKTTVHGGQLNTGGGGAFTLEQRFSDTRLSGVHISELDDGRVASLEPTGPVSGVVFENLTLSTDTFVGSTAFAIAARGSEGTIGDVVVADCRLPSVQEYHCLVGGSAAAFTDDITVERCTMRGNRAILECEATEGADADDAIFVVRDCIQRDLADSDPFRDHAYRDRLVVLDNDFLDSSVDEVEEALAWDGNREIDTS
jgi:hypothetical protein